MIKKQFFLQSNFGNVRLDCAEYVGEDIEKKEREPRGIVQIVHGMCEYKERYEPFIEFLTSNGYIVFAHDHRGHGNSVKEQSEIGYFGDKKGVAIVEDTAKVTDEIEKRYPSLPLTLFGHSMGSLVVRVYLQKYEEKIDRLIVCGAPSKNALAGAGIALNNCISLFKGAKHRSALMAKLSTGGGDEDFPGEGKNAWLTRDVAVREAYNADEKCNFTFTCNGFSNLLHLMKKTYRKRRYPVRKSDLPILFIAGAADPVTINAKKREEACLFMRKIGYTDVVRKEYEAMRHEILNEIGKEEVYNDVLRFLSGEKIV